MVKTKDNVMEWYQSNFELFTNSESHTVPSYLKTARQNAFKNFKEQGFPTTRNEEWRFTNIQPIAKKTFKPIVIPDELKLTEEQLKPWCYDGAIRLVFINGSCDRQRSDLSLLPAGVRVESLKNVILQAPELLERYLAKEISYDNNSFAALNGAFLQDGALIIVDENCTIDKPIHLLFLVTSQIDTAAVQPYNLIVANRNSRCSLVESYGGLGENCYLSNPVTTIIVEEDAIVEHDKLQFESFSSYHISTQQIEQKTGSKFLSNSIMMGGSIVRNTINSHLDGEGIDCTLNGLSLGTGDQVIDNHTAIDHAKPNCESHELYKAILDGKSRGIFNGKIFVRKDAQKTDAKQTNKTLVLSDDAAIDTKPQLEIFADDVKCTHGATVGQLDEEQVFYLRSRGISESRARDILTYAFAADVVGRIQIEEVKRQLELLIHKRLDQGRLLEGTV
ncbi:MAG: Fe-S cluster assembly protein SufD [bacterium]